MTSPTVQLVVEQQLCAGCGTCVTACPAGAIAMRLSPAGFLQPAIDAALCTQCGLCHKVCCGVHYCFDLPPDVDRLLKPSPFKAFLGNACDPEIRGRGQSGGVVTALLAHMLERGGITHALVTRFERDGSHRLKPFFAASREELLDSAGSHYCHNALNAALVARPPDARLAAVGLACHMHGLANLQAVLPARWGATPAIRVGLLCHMSCSYLGIERLLRRCGGRQVARVHYRRKLAGTHRGAPCAEFADGSFQSFEPEFLGRMFNETLSAIRCQFCFDKMNRTSDIALGDANGFAPEIVAAGTNVVIAHTPRGLEALRQACEAGAIELHECDFEQVCRGQRLMTVRKSRLLAAYSRWRKLGRATPQLAAMDNAELDPAPLESRVLLRHLCRLDKARTPACARRRAARYETVWGALLRLGRRLGRLFGR